MKYVIWGTGEFSKFVLKNIDAACIETFIDNDQEKIGKIINGKSIISLEEYIARKSEFTGKICIASQAYKEISEQLVRAGFTEEIDFFDGVERLTNEDIINIFGMESFIETEFIEIFKETKKYTMTNWVRMYSLYKSVKYIVSNGIQGDFIECGVWRGGSALIMVKTLERLGVFDRTVFLFDTFKGMSKPVKGVDISLSGGSAIEKWDILQGEGYNNWCYASLEDVKNNFKQVNYPENKIKFIEGDVLETIPETNIDKIALLRLDTDWYESTKIELEYLFPKLQEKGVLILDDFGDWLGAQKATVEYFEKINCELFLHRIDPGARIAIK